MRKLYSVGYFSSYDRGLETLLDMFPAIKEQVPEATLDIYYGWQMFDKYHSKNPEKMKWKWQMIRKMAAVGAVDHGRVSHEELADAMKEIQVWAYPTEFTEIHCITALKAQEAGCIPVTTNVGALAETVVSGHKGELDEIPDLIVKALKGDKGKTGEVKDRYWTDVAKAWDKALA